jgi:glycosyltransferase involved in cell wall biosynthesis
MAGLLIFDTHPITYRSPVFRALEARRADFKVYYLSSGFDGNRWWFHERGNATAQDSGLPLTEGFPNETLETPRLGTLKRILKRERPEAVVVYGYYLPEHWWLRWLTARQGIPLLFVGETFAPSGSIVKGALRKYFFRGVSRFIAIGNKTADYYRALGIAPERIDQGKYCADVSFFEGEGLRDRFREEHGIPKDAFVLLFAGRLFERKRPLDLLALHERLGNVQTVFAGSGPLMGALDGPRVHVLGFQDQKALKAAYHGADLLVVPSEYETWGLVVNEAFAAGTPALVTETCGVAGDLVLPGETGLVYKAGELLEAERQIRFLVENREACRQLGRAAQKRVNEHYRSDQFAEVLWQSSLEARKPLAKQKGPGLLPKAAPTSRPGYEY